MTNPLYFDYAATTPLDESVFEAMKPWFTEHFQNPSALYMSGEKVRAAVEQARVDVASVLQCKPAGIIFTAGCTEANNIAIHGVMSQYPGQKVVVSAVEHDAVLAPAETYERIIAPVENDGLIDLTELSSILDDEDVVLVSVMYVNNEVGTIQPLREITALIAQKKLQRTSKTPLFFHTDAAQAPLYMPVNVYTLGIDLMSLNGGKIYGPKQSGCLYVGQDIELKSILQGGGQERGLRSGTENVPAIIGFAKALKDAHKYLAAESARLHELQSYFIQACADFGGQLVAERGPRAPHIVSMYFPGIDNERIVMEVDQKGIEIASGSACHAKSRADSTVLSALGMPVDAQKSMLRVSIGRFTTIDALDQLATVLKELILPRK
jgi:cysteine desulfurase